MLEMINVSYAYKSKKEIVHVLDKVTYRFEIGKTGRGGDFAGWRKYTKYWWKKTAPK